MVTITIPIEVLESMKKIVDMYIFDENKDFMSQFEDDKVNKDINEHIYNDLELVNRFLHSQDLNAELYQQGVIK